VLKRQGTIHGLSQSVEGFVFVSLAAYRYQ
jgi:hypothetical protein